MGKFAKCFDHSKVTIELYHLPDKLTNQSVAASIIGSLECLDQHLQNSEIKNIFILDKTYFKFLSVSACFFNILSVFP